VIARDDLYPDALAAGPLAAKLGAPLLLSPPTNVPTRLSDEIRRLGATTAYLIGDETALSGGIEADVRAAGVTDVHRIGGATRYDTAALIAEQVGGSSVYIARGDDFPDAASVSALASYQRRPILLTTPSALPEATTDELRTLGVRHATIVGGGDAVSAAVQTALSHAGLSVDRLAGSTRYGTSAAVADRAVAAGMTGQNWLVDGANWPDAVAAGPAAAQGKGILLLVDPVDLSRSPETRDWLALHPSDAITAVGGPDVVSPADAVGALRQ
jgi:putative cell wall-binding protein